MLVQAADLNDLFTLPARREHRAFLPVVNINRLFIEVFIILAAEIARFFVDIFAFVSLSLSRCGTLTVLILLLGLHIILLVLLRLSSTSLPTWA